MPSLLRTPRIWVGRSSGTYSPPRKFHCHLSWSVYFLYASVSPTWQESGLAHSPLIPTAELHFWHTLQRPEWIKETTETRRKVWPYTGPCFPFACAFTAQNQLLMSVCSNGMDVLITVLQKSQYWNSQKLCGTNWFMPCNTSTGKIYNAVWTGNISKQSKMLRNSLCLIWSKKKDSNGGFRFLYEAKLNCSIILQRAHLFSIIGKTELIL